MLQTAAPVANADAALEYPFAVQHLDAIVVAVTHDKVVIFVVRDVAFSRKLAITVAWLTEGRNQFTVKLKNLNRPVTELDSNIVAAPVDCNAGGICRYRTAFCLARKAKRPNELTGCIVQHLHAMVPVICHDDEAICDGKCARVAQTERAVPSFASAAKRAQNSAIAVA